MFDFPSAGLTVGQIVTGPNNIQYQWDGTKWVASATAGLVSANLVYAGPVSGVPVVASFRALAIADIPVLPYTKLPTEVQQLPIGFSWSGKPAAGAILNIPMAIAVTVNANLSGTVGFASTLPAASATFTVNKVSGGTITALGTAAIGTGGAMTLAGAGGSLAINDVLQCVAPATQDGSLANFGLSVLCMRV